MSRRSALSLSLGALLVGALVVPAVAQGYTVPAVEQPLALGFFSGFPPMDGGGVSGNKVVYTLASGGNADIYCYDISTRVMTPVTTNPADQFNPSISGNTIVYEDRRDWGTSSRVYSYDLVAHKEQLISASPHPAEVPVISGRNVVWQYYNEQGDGKYTVWCYNLDSHTQRSVSSLPAAANQTNPAIEGNNIVWEDRRHGNSEIWYAQLPSMSTRALTAAANGAATYPSVSGQYAAWLDSRNAPAPVEIYTWDLLANSGQQRITDDSLVQGRPKVSGSKLVWSDSSNGNPDIQCYDFGAHATWPLTVDTHSQSAPFISGDKVVWQDNRTGMNAIYLGELVTPRLSVSMGPTVVAYGAKPRVTGSLFSVSSTPIASQAIRLDYSHDGAMWFNGPSGVTNASGAFSLTSSPLTNAMYVRVNFLGDPQQVYPSVQSTGVLVKPRAVLTKPVTPSKMSRKKSYAVHGNLTPKHSSGSNVGTLRCYRWEKRRWRLRKSFVLTASDYGAVSRYKATVKLSSKGKWRMRAYHSDADHAPTYSGWRRVTVK